MKGLFVTGTDTGIGKTVISATLTVGLEACYWKPVQAGINPTDSELVTEWTGLASERVLPEGYRLKRPASPHLAAREEGLAIDVRRLALPNCNRTLVVEGAGGVLVPLNREHLMIDLMKSLGLPIVVVASSRLGTINHTLLTLEALRKRELQVLTVIMSGVRNEENEEAVSTYGNVAVIPFPELRVFDCDALRRAFQTNLAERWESLANTRRAHSAHSRVTQ